MCSWLWWSMASDDPEGWEYLYKTLRKAGEDYDINIVTNFNGVTSLEVNAFQTCSSVIIQKSIREGFGLTVSEGSGRYSCCGGNVGGSEFKLMMASMDTWWILLRSVQKSADCCEILKWQKRWVL